MNKVKYYVLLLLFFLPSLVYSQASGGQIKRNVQRTTSKINKRGSLSKKTSRTYTTREMVEMGQSFYDKGNYTEAMNWYKKAAENGSSDAQSELGFMYLNGEGTPVDKTEGAKWLIKAGDNGDAMAQRALGYMYRNGDGVYKSELEANKWFGKATPKFYEAARGLMKSNGQAAIQLFSWVYDMRQKPHDVWSLFHIGEIYYYSLGNVDFNYKEAFNYFKMASDTGNNVATYYVGICYETGNGITKDINLAKEYYRKSGYNSLPSRDF